MPLGLGDQLRLVDDFGEVSRRCEQPVPGEMPCGGSDPVSLEHAMVIIEICDALLLVGGPQAVFVGCDPLGGEEPRQMGEACPAGGQPQPKFVVGPAAVGGIKQPRRFNHGASQKDGRLPEEALPSQA